tara:strand:- start:2940 stop:3524 length:585 start_codon:yes stop_codon:yes gene_type:complete
MSQLNVNTIKHSSGTGPGIDITSTGNVSIDTNTLFIDSVNDRIGVGTVTPNAALEVSTSGGAIFNSTPLREKLFVTSNTINGNSTIDLFQGNSRFYTNASTGNWTLNITASGTTVSSLIANNRALVVNVVTRCGGSSGYQSGFQIDGSNVTVEWLGGTAPNARGGTSGFDQWQMIILKTGNTSYTVLGSQNHFE